MKKKNSFLKFTLKCVLMLVMSMIPTMLFMVSDGSRLMDGLATGSVFLVPVLGFLMFNSNDNEKQKRGNERVDR